MSLRIELEQVAKRYRHEWIFRRIDLTLESDRRYAITGPNGSGKSTLMRILSGHLSPSRGAVRFYRDERHLDINELYRELAYAAPYIELIEELTLEEAIDFHRRFQPLQAGLDTPGLIRLLGLRRARTKPVRFFSSGMKQRLKLALAICSDAPLLLLDEPSTNLDQQGIEWYLDLISRYGVGRLIAVASNVAVDHQFCDQRIDVLQYKNRQES